MTKREVITNLKNRTCNECAWWGTVNEYCVFPHDKHKILRDGKLDYMNINLGCDDWCKEIDIQSLRDSGILPRNKT